MSETDKTIAFMLGLIVLVALVVLQLAGVIDVTTLFDPAEQRQP